MKIPRVTVTHLAILVAVVAVNLAVGRALYGVQTLFNGIVLMTVALQIALYRFVRIRGTKRWFWLGFMAFGFPAMVSFIWALYHPTTYRVIPNGGMVPVSPEDAIRKLWGDYMKVIFACFGTKNVYKFHYDKLFIIHFLPQLIIALSGGLIFRQIARLLAVRQETGDGAASVPSRVD